MDSIIARELERIAAAIPEVRDQIDLAADEDAVPADVARAEKLVAALLERWEGILRKLDDTERAHLQRELGLKIEVLKAHLLKLREDL